MGDSIAALQRQFTTGRRGRHARHETMKRAISALATYMYSHDTAQEERRQASAFLLLCTIGGLAIFSSTIAKNPVLPILAQQLGADKGMIGWVAAASTLTGILASLPAGLLSDRWGRRRLLLGAGIVFVSAPLAYVLLAFWPWPWVYALCGISGGLAFLGMWWLPNAQASSPPTAAASARTLADSTQVPLWT